MKFYVRVIRDSPEPVIYTAPVDATSAISVGASVVAKIRSSELDGVRVAGIHMPVGDGADDGVPRSWPPWCAA